MEVIAPITSAIITTIIAFSTFFFLDGRIGEYEELFGVSIHIGRKWQVKEASGHSQRQRGMPAVRSHCQQAA